MCRLALLPAVLVLALAAPAPASAGPSRVSYRPPVDAPIVDAFRPPVQRWDRANRGVDYATQPGTPVKSAADGEVVFAGAVGGRLHVVVLHADGIRTSYSFLRTIAVRRGDPVRQGQVVGTSGERLHFGARAGDTYLDPTTLFDTGPPHVYLVPDEARRRGTEFAERAGLARFLAPFATFSRRAAGAGATAVDVAASGVREVAREVGREVSDGLEELRGAGHYAGVGNPLRGGFGLVRHTVAWWNQRRDCTPAGVRPPPLPERRVAVLIAGLGSGSDRQHSSIDAIDGPGMGYVETLRFSYGGGSTEANPYGGRDTTQDLREMGDRLLELLEQVHRDHPNEAVDILAHSQGGLVARSALAYGYDARDPRYPRVANLITLATPHTGADLATAATMVGQTEAGELIQLGFDAARLAPFDVTGPSVRQMSETSWFLTRLNRTRAPDNVRLTSIGTRGDLVVPALHTRLAGARNAIVSTPGWWTDHSDLPGSDAGRREVALAAAGLPPTCESFTNMVADYWTANVISTGEDLVGGALYVGARRLDRYGVQDPPVALPARRRP